MEWICKIVKLKRMMRRWRSLTCTTCVAGSLVPAGYAAVYVGPELRRFEIRARYLNLPVIAALLEKAAGEFGGAHPAGGLTLPCEPVFFRWVLRLLARDEPRFRGLALEDFSRLFADFVNAGGDCAAAVRSLESRPLLQTATF